VADDRLDQPVQLEAIGLAAGQGQSDHRSQEVIQGDRVGGCCSEWFVQQLGVGGEQPQRDRFRSKKSGQLQQWHGRWAVSVEAFQRYRPGRVDTALVAEHVTFGEHTGPAGTKSVYIVGWWESRLFQVGGGLGRGKGQIPEFSGELIGELGSNSGIRR
jgi:hypothetical protein